MHQKYIYIYIHLPQRPEEDNYIRKEIEGDNHS